MKNRFLFSAFTLLGLALPLMFANNNKAQAFTLTDNGEYALVMKLKGSDYGATIDGSLDGKVVKFNFDEGEELKLSDLTNGIKPFNGKNEFSGWALSYDDTTPAPGDTLLKKEDFSGAEEQLGDIKYKNGKSVYALFDGKEIENSYSMILDGFAGNIEGQDKLRFEFDPDNFQKIDLSKYKPTREGYKFCGWGYYSEDTNGKFVTSIDRSYFNKENNITVFALYKSNSFYGVDEDGKLNNPNLAKGDRPESYVLILDANGGTIDGQSSKKYDYDNGGNKDNSMPIFHYIPERPGCKFKGWNAKKDGSGESYDLISYERWRADGGDFDRDLLRDNGKVYTNLTLYATWEGTPLEDTEETGTEIPSISDIKGSVQFQDSIAIDENYTLDIEKLEIPQELADKNVKFLVDIILLKDQEIVPLNGTEMKIKFEIPEELNGYNNYQIVYIKDGEIKETLPATVKDGYIIFETTHLSQYGVIATNIEGNG